MMNARGIGAAAVCRTVVLPGCIVAGFAMFGSAGLENIGASMDEVRAPPVIADAAPAPSPATAGSNTADEVANVVTAGGSEAVATVNPEPTSQEPDTGGEARLTDPTLAPETQPAQAPVVNTPDPEPREAKVTVGSIEVLDECWDVNVCIDRYLWVLYQRTPKEDTIKVPEQRTVMVKKKKKMVKVTRTFIKLVDEDFTWKDAKAAQRAAMPMADYVIGGMDRSFKLKLFHALLAAEQAGLSPGITSAFRDDYRQSIASGLKAASDRSYHGGSFRGGYGHGLAADIVSVDGATRDERWRASDKLWKWIDAHGREFGVGRPYLDRDPPHTAPIDGKEYAAHNHGAKTQQAALDVKTRNRSVARDNHAKAKRPRTAKSSKVRTI